MTWIRLRSSRADRSSLPEHALALEQDVAGGRLLELEQQPAEGALAGAALADEAERLAPLDRERHVLDRDERLLLAAQAPQEAARDCGKCFVRRRVSSSGVSALRHGVLYASPSRPGDVRVRVDLGLE